MAPPLLLTVACAAQGRPEFCAPVRSELKFLRKHPDDDSGVAIQYEGVAEHIEFSTKPLLPCRITEDDRDRRSRRIFVWLEIATNRRGHSQRAEETSAHPRAGNLFGPVSSAQAKASVQRISIHGMEHPVSLLPILEVKVRKPAARGPERGFEYRHKLGLISVRQRIDERRLYKTKHRGYGGDAQSENGYRRAREYVGVQSVVGGWAYQESRAAHSKGSVFNAQGQSLNSVSSKDGRTQWKAEVNGGKVDPNMQVFSPPALGHDYIYLSSSLGHLLSVRQKDGELGFAYSFKKPMIFQPALVAGNVYVGTGDGMLICLKTNNKDADGWYEFGGNSQHNK